MSAAAADQRNQTVIAFITCILSLGILGLAFNGILASPIAALRETSPEDLAARNAALGGIVRGASLAGFWAALGVALGAVLAVLGGRVEAAGKGINAAAALVVAFAALMIFQATGVTP